MSPCDVLSISASHILEWVIVNFGQSLESLELVTVRKRFTSFLKVT